MPITFETPIALFALLLIPFILYFYNIYRKKKKSSSIKFSSLGIIKQALSKKTNIRAHIPFILITLSILFIIVGLSNPHIPLKTLKKGVNVVLVIDDSGSMSAKDYTPTRLEAAKQAAQILIESLNPKDNIGIVIFESGATTAAYLTPFKDKALSKLKAIQQKEGSTAIGDGLALAIDMATAIPNKKKVIILLSDGVNNAGVISPQEAVQFAKLNKIQVHTIGMGSEEPVILGYDFFGNPQYAQLDENTLKQIAQETGGKYSKSVDTDTLNNIYKNISQDIEREWEHTSIAIWFYILALITLIINIYIIYGRYRIII